MLRLIRAEGVRGWYQAKQQRGEKGTKKALIGVMRKLALALYRVAVSGVRFEARQLFPGVRSGGRPGPSGRGGGAGPTRAAAATEPSARGYGFEIVCRF